MTHGPAARARPQLTSYVQDLSGYVPPRQNFSLLTNNYCGHGPVKVEGIQGMRGMPAAQAAVQRRRSMRTVPAPQPHMRVPREGPEPGTETPGAPGIDRC